VIDVDRIHIEVEADRRQRGAEITEGGRACECGVVECDGQRVERGVVALVAERCVEREGRQGVFTLHRARTEIEAVEQRAEIHARNVQVALDGG